jgi:choline-glycine betaine transporter
MKKRIFLAFLVVVVVVAMAVPVFAAEGDVDITSVMTTAFSATIENMMNAAAAVLPICMTVLGLSVTVGFGIKWFKRLTGKA